MTTQPRYKIGDRVTVAPRDGVDFGSGIVSEVHSSGTEHYYFVKQGTGTLGVMEDRLSPDRTPANGDASRPLPALMRELADYAASLPDGTVNVRADTVRAWADEIEALEALRDSVTDVPQMLEDVAMYDDWDFTSDDLRAKAAAIRTALTPPTND